jgi:hypothetical protein
MSAHLSLKVPHPNSTRARRIPLYLSGRPLAGGRWLYHEPLEIGSQADNKHDDWGYWAYGLDPDYL